MKLEKFKKNKKQKKIIIASVIGILVVVGSIILYKTYAYYEEKKTFNVLQGTVPEFNTSDIELALTLDGEKVDSIPKINNNENGGYAKIEADCKDTADIIWDTDKWGTIITNIRSSKVQCNISFETFYNSVNVGDYVSYTPSSISYTIDSSLTGYTDDVQTINPSELNLWRVISKNDDGSINIVSQYVSSVNVTFYGYTGFKNLIGYLNEIASQYETEGITSGSRYLGYNGQIAYCTSYSINTDCPTDKLYITDTELVETAVGTLVAYKVNETNTATYYWLPSRYWGSSTDLRVRNVNSDGRVDGYGLVAGGIENSRMRALRPIVTLKSGITANGFGTSENPWKVN